MWWVLAPHGPMWGASWCRLAPSGKCMKPQGCVHVVLQTAHAPLFEQHSTVLWLGQFLTKLRCLTLSPPQVGKPHLKKWPAHLKCVWVVAGVERASSERAQSSEERPGNSDSSAEGNLSGSTEKTHIFPREHPWNCSSPIKSSQQSAGKTWGRQQGTLPPGRQTRSTVSSTVLTWSAHRHMCCYKHLHTHSLGNIAVGIFKK